MESKNVYQKLQAAREELSRLKIQKTGKNLFSKYDYFELGDFLPSINEICNRLGLTPVVTFPPENALLTLFDSDNPEKFIVFNSPSAGVELKGMHAIQNQGAIQTYQRRYLYMTAFEISNPDEVDRLPEKKENTPPVPKYTPPAMIAMTDQILQKAVTRINKGETGILEKAKNIYSMTPEQEKTLFDLENFAKTFPTDDSKKEEPEKPADGQPPKKEELKIGTVEFGDAMDHLKNGGKIEDFVAWEIGTAAMKILKSVKPEKKGATE